MKLVRVMSHSVSLSSQGPHAPPNSPMAAPMTAQPFMQSINSLQLSLSHGALTMSECVSPRLGRSQLANVPPCPFRPLFFFSSCIPLTHPPTLPHPTPFHSGFVSMASCRGTQWHRPFKSIDPRSPLPTRCPLSLCSFNPHIIPKAQVNPCLRRVAWK